MTCGESRLRMSAAVLSCQPSCVCHTGLRWRNGSLQRAEGNTMTHHSIRITDHFAALIQRGAKTAELRYDDRDFQTGDTLNFCHDDTGKARRYMETRTITHVLKNFAGLQAGYVVLSLDEPELAYYRAEVKRYRAEAERLAKSNASLRGSITKLRKRLAAS